MADPKPGEPFGLNSTFIEKIDWHLTLKRIIHDLRTDFIYAPHLGFIYRLAGKNLIDQLKSDLKSGTYNPDVPLTIEVPKSFRMRVAVASKRLGPSFSRPGSILLPLDRLLYQALADQAAPIVDQKADHLRSFSHKLAAGNAPEMFLPTRTCWNSLQKCLKKHATEENLKYIVKIDIVNFFGSLNQHILVNVLTDSKYPKSLASRLELLLTGFTNERSSRGILQGIFPSDLFGNFYMAPVDRFLEEYGVASARYVDDMYIFVESVDAAERMLRELIPFLRSYDLVLNEAKCVVIPKGSLLTEEPDLEELFGNAVQEIAKQIDDADFDAEYGFQSEWADEESDGDSDDTDLELRATKILFDSIETYPGHEENIERFCLPLFAKTDSSYAVNHVLDAFKKRPAMSQIYASYLSNFLGEPKVLNFMARLLEDDALTDWQKMWVLAALLQTQPIDDKAVRSAMKILRDANRHDALRAVAAVYIGKFGDMDRRKALVTIYPKASDYIQLAIYYSSRYWSGIERSNAKANWGNQGYLNSLLTVALAAKPKS